MEIGIWREGFLARISQWLVGRLGSRWATNRGFGSSTPVLLQSFDLVSRSWRTSEISRAQGFIGSSPTFLKRGMMRNGAIYVLPMLERPTGEKDFGLWRTPEAHDSGGGPMADETRERYFVQKEKRPSGHPAQLTLRDQVRDRRLWPTPLATDSRHGDQGKGRMGTLPRLISFAEGSEVRGRLSPEFHQWLMGFPAGWTDIGPTGSDVRVTLSCRK
jgi:hypothetical protein